VADGRPLAGGFIGGHIGVHAVFFGTSVLMAAGAISNLVVKRRGAAVGHED
jgi:MFS transporter, DHA1 family, multidrug resistance protein